jgi:hypothetical protein
LRDQSKLKMCDLAGSERVRYTNSTGETLREATKINQVLGAGGARVICSCQSLLALSNVVHALTENNRPHGAPLQLEPAARFALVPFRDAVLTYILRDSLGGNTKLRWASSFFCLHHTHTRLCVCCSSEDRDASETLRCRRLDTFSITACSSLRFAKRAKLVRNNPLRNDVKGMEQFLAVRPLL